MPDLPAAHRPLTVPIKTHVTAENEWGQKKVVRKLTGRPWRRLRERILKRDLYLCQRCFSIGRFAQANEVDHIKPLANGGDDAESNLQSLCIECHQIKSASEGGRASVKPEWLPKPVCPVVLIVGPPGAGKTTYARAQKGSLDVVIDLDDCFEDVCGVHGHFADRIHLTAALRLRNARLADLARQREGTAYVIVSCPKQVDEQWWANKLSASVVLLDPGPDVIRARVDVARFLITQAWYDQRAISTRAQSPVDKSVDNLWIDTSGGSK